MVNNGIVINIHYYVLHLIDKKNQYINIIT